jgi:hypothetical protein
MAGLTAVWSLGQRAADDSTKIKASPSSVVFTPRASGFNMNLSAILIFFLPALPEGMDKKLVLQHHMVFRKPE